MEGRWNFDADNRERPPHEARPPKPNSPREDEIDAGVRHDLDAMGLDTWGDDVPRRWPATRAEARRALRRFVEQRLTDFGRWQDAMLHGEQLMWHAHVSSSLNLGLLDPMECVDAAVAALDAGVAPINAVEGFVRQVIGWREYVWGTYWEFGDDWARDNALDAGGELPEAFWGGPTEMRCLEDSVRGLRETGYAHDIHAEELAEIRRRGTQLRESFDA